MPIVRCISNAPSSLLSCGIFFRDRTRAGGAVRRLSVAFTLPIERVMIQNHLVSLIPASRTSHARGMAQEDLLLLFTDVTAYRVLTELRVTPPVGEFRSTL